MKGTFFVLLVNSQQFDGLLPCRSPDAPPWGTLLRRSIGWIELLCSGHNHRIFPIQSSNCPLMTQSSAEDISPAAEAYVWGFLLVSVHCTRLLPCSKTDTGVLNHIDELTTTNDLTIVVPNNDTLYSSAWYDLRHGDLIIDLPAEPPLSRSLALSSTLS